MSLKKESNFKESAVIRIVLFSIGTLAFTWLSQKALMNPGSHGFYRFFVFEGIPSVSSPRCSFKVKFASAAAKDEGS